MSLPLAIYFIVLAFLVGVVAGNAEREPDLDWCCIAGALIFCVLWPLAVCVIGVAFIYFVVVYELLGRFWDRP
jgi:hypothetical protein